MPINSFIPVKCVNGDASFFKAWMSMLSPYHKLSNREMEVAARILMQYFKFKNNMPEDPDPSVLRELLWSRSSRKDIMESLKMSQAHFQMVLAKLRAHGPYSFLVNGDINAMYIPKLEPGMKRYFLCFGFDWSSKANPIRREEEQTRGERL